MARFNAAKMWGALDLKFQQVYNQLIDLLDSGYEVVLTVNSIVTRVLINAREGISVYSNDKKVFGLDATGSIFAQKISDPDDNSRYLTVGDGDGTSTASGITVWSKLTGGTGSQKRFYLQTYASSGSGFFGIPRTGSSPDYEGTLASSFSHGDAYLFASDSTCLAQIKMMQGTKEFNISANGYVFVSVPTYANNAAAVAGGLGVGALYRNNADPDLLCIVH